MNSHYHSEKKISTCQITGRKAFNEPTGKRRRCLKMRNTNQDCTYFVQNLITKGYAERMPDEQSSPQPRKLWYLPHHGVYQAKKPDKIRVVFDCSAWYRETSLNNNLLQGPDLTNTLVGVLTRFRKGTYAFMADFESMLYQVTVPENQRDFLRFVW